MGVEPPGVSPKDSMIGRLFLYWFPGIDLPPNDYKWNKLLCPFVDEERPSATLNYEDGCFNCFGCGHKGDIISLIRRKEDLGYNEAVFYAEKLFGPGYTQVRSGPKGKSRRRVFGESRT